MSSCAGARTLAVRDFTKSVIFLDIVTLLWHKCHIMKNCESGRRLSDAGGRSGPIALETGDG